MEEKENLRVNVILIEHKESLCGGKNRFLVTPHLQIIAQSSDTRFFAAKRGDRKSCLRCLNKGVSRKIATDV